MTAAEFTARLDGVKPNGHGWVARCPAHDDRMPSLSVKQEGDRVLVHCHAGCDVEAVLAGLGLEARDLFCDEPKTTSTPTLGPIVATYD
jgi:hypothetical protein